LQKFNQLGGWSMTVIWSHSLAVLLALATVGCASPDPKARTQSLGSSILGLDCKFWQTLPITVDGTANQITLPNPICVLQVLGGHVVWQLPDSGYRFDGSCVLFDSGQTTGVVVNRGRLADDRKCFVDVGAIADAQWVYSLVFETTTSPPRRWTCDPTIVNRDPAGFGVVVVVPLNKLDPTVTCSVTP
jgi:hypothetical protein